MWLASNVMVRHGSTIFSANGSLKMQVQGNNGFSASALNKDQGRAFTAESLENAAPRPGKKACPGFAQSHDLTCEQSGSLS